MLSHPSLQHLHLRHSGAVVELMPHRSTDPGSILTLGAVFVEFVDGFSLSALVSAHIPKTYRCVGLIGFSKILNCPRCVG